VSVSLYPNEIEFLKENHLSATQAVRNYIDQEIEGGYVKFLERRRTKLLWELEDLEAKMKVIKEKKR
jgi:hypothetical protein